MTPNASNLLSKEKTTKQNRIWVRVSAACNNKCVFCLDSDAQNGTLIPSDKVEHEIKSWIKAWYENRVIISWWEASINPKFPQYIKFAKESWYDRVQTVTNGNMFAQESFCKKVFDAWLDEVTFSFHWHDPKLHDYLVATPGAFKKSLKWLLNVKKNYPHVIVNIDIVVNKINVRFLPDIVKFFMRLGIYEYDILQIIPFWRWFSQNKEKLFYNLEENKEFLLKTWELSRIPWMYMWTNRFPVEAFEWYEDLIQDPRKIKSEVMWEGAWHFRNFIESNWEKTLECYKNACDVCFLNQYCNNFIEKKELPPIESKWKYFTLRWEEFPSQIYEKYWEKKEDFFWYISKVDKPIINLPKCLWWTWIYESYNDLKKDGTLEDYTYAYIWELYRKKSLRCKKCTYNNECEWIHLNFIRSYWFEILNPI